MSSPSFPGSADISTFYGPRDPRLHGWLREALEEGERLNRQEPAYQKADEVIRYLMGDQITGDHPSFLHKVVINRLRKAFNAHVATLTDLRPFFSWQTKNPAFEPSGQLLSQYHLVWWMNAEADQELADAVRYSLAAGAGDVWVEYDRNFLEGDNRIFARDPRDTIPINPETARIENWEGVTLRQEISLNKLRAKYPGMDAYIKPDSGTLGGIFSRYKGLMINEAKEEPSTLDGLGSKSPLRKPQYFGKATLYRSFFRDRSINKLAIDVTMGEAGTNYSYIVKPMGLLYPRGRLVIWTEHGILWDGPNPYWHAKPPVCRLRLDPWPWLLLGLGRANDLLPGQTILNTTVNDVLQTLSQWVNRGSIWDRNMPQSQRDRFDSRKPHWRIQRPNSFSEGFKLVDGPQLPPFTMQFLQFMFAQFDDLAETANLQQLLSLRQSPSGETIEKYLEAMTPGIRLEGRQVEIFLRSLATQLKGNVFQFQSKAKRMMLLGQQAGQTLEDLDFDPDTLVPAMVNKGQKDYVPELDASIPRAERAQWFMGQFSFFIAPDSLLSLHAQEKKLLYIQLNRMGLLDPKTLFDMLEIPGFGEYPTIPLPVPDWRPPADWNSSMPPPLVPRKPETIIEKLIAAQQLGIGLTVNPAGRKATAQSPPGLQQNTPTGPPTVTES